MLIIFAITILLIFFEFVIGIASLVSRRNIYQKFNRPLTSLIRFSKLLEMYHDKIPQLRIEVDDGSFVLYYSANRIIINKKIIHSTTMYDLVYLIYGINISQPRFRTLLKIKAFQNIVFIFSILFLVASFFLINLIAVSFVFVLLNYFIFIYTLMSFSDLNKVVYSDSLKYLELDEIEQIRIKSLINELKYEFLDYPFEIPIRVFYSLK